MSPAEASGAEKLLAEDHDDLDLLLSAIFDSLDARNPTDVLARLDLFWARLAMHIRSEHLHLFPAIEKGCRDHAVSAHEKSNIDQALARLREDHDFFMRQLAGEVNSLREMTADSEQSADIKMAELERRLAELRSRLKAHNVLEEDIVYRLPSELLDEVKQSALATGVNKELENLPPRFRD